jgi:ATP-dependent Clp protease protease subunit
MIRAEDHEHHKPSFQLGYPASHIKLTKGRCLFVSEVFSNTMAAEMSALLLYLDKKDPEEPIQIYIHSPGGAATALSNIYDVMQMISAPVKTICTGRCFSAGAVLLAAGTKGYRYAFRSSRIMIHGIQSLFPLAGHDITASKNYYEFLRESNNSIMQILADHTGHPLSKIKEDCKEDVWLTPQQALEYGIIDHIIH